MEQPEPAEISLESDDILLRRVRASRSSRRLTLIGTTLSLLLIVGAMVFFLVFPANPESYGTSRPGIASAPVPDTPEQLDALIEMLQQKLRKPGRAKDYHHLAAAYRKRFELTQDSKDQLRAMMADEKFQSLMKKNPSKERFMKASGVLFPFMFVVLIIGVIGVIVMLLQNGLVRRDEAVDARWSQVETQLQRRLDLVPQLVETVKGYAKHEQDTLLRVTRARTRLADALQQTTAKAPTDEAAAQQLAEASTALGTELHALLVMVERYPDLKASQSFIGLQDQLEGTENRIAVERQRYNESVRLLNTRLRAFPHNVVAGMFGFEAREYLQAKLEAAEPVKVKF